MRSYVVLVLAGCGFQHGTATEDAAIPDAPDANVDMMIDAPAPFCAADPHLRLCYSFDQDPLPPSLANEGAANVSATLTNVTHTARGATGAAQIDSTSMIYVPYTAEVTNIQGFEVSFRADGAPAINGARLGILDTNVIPPNVSFFLYRVDPGYQLRCGLGGALYAFDAPLVLGMWHDAVCTCTADTLQIYLDGAKIGEQATSGCSSGGGFVSAGMTIGQNNNGGPTGADEWLVGAVDNVRLWDVPVAPPQ
ncbi:MAG TPA: LamG-like jellyroll fold domain-containing protein [Kofleriaceae bacterium]|nr:LamG-like jellyroll fold domain-containing protein [Kofleriaceae bacterium]